MRGDDLVYRIADEPRPGRLNRLVLNPFIIFLLSMLLTFVVGCVWLLFNAFAMGSPYAKRNLFVVIGSVVVFVIAYFGGIAVLSASALPIETFAPYLRLAFTVFWIVLCYYLFMSQMKVYPIFQYYRQRSAGPAAGG